MSAKLSVFNSKTEPTWILNATPHPGQVEVSDAIHKALEESQPGMEPSVFTIIGSRGWGKTLFLVTQVLIPFAMANPNGRVLWVGPQYQTALAFVDDVLKATDEETGKRWVPDYDEEGNKIWEFIQSTASGPQVRFWNGCTVTIKSADSPESIVGRGYNLIIMDEAALIDERVFLQQIMGTARKKGIKIYIITSPRGKRHWTHRYYQLGQDKSQPDYLSFKQPWYKNPKFSEILKRLMKSLPDWIVKQEYEAEFLEDGDTVFKNLGNVVVGPEINFETPEQEWNSGPVTDKIIKTPEDKEIRIKAEHRRFVIGLDLAKSIDFTVMWVMDVDTGECVYYRRVNKTDYRVILKSAEQLSKRFNNAELVFDATGVGSGLADFFQNFDVTVHPYTFTNESKNELITSLAIAIEYNQISLPNIQTVVNEFGVFTYGLTRTGKLTYGAPPGYHDDIVIAVALANWYRKENIGSMDLEGIDNFLGAVEGSPKSFRQFMEDDND